MRYPGAKWTPFPENATQPAIRPTQVIHHVTASSGPISGTWKYFAMETTVVESHFGVDFADAAWQGIDDEIRADANYRANLRPDGTGAISVETRGEEFGYWTDWQIDWLVAHGVWCHERHGVPLRICRTPADPGFGYHTLFGAPSDWTPVTKTCPGPNRIKQWRDIVFPRIEAKEINNMGAIDDTAANREVIEKAVMQALNRGDLWRADSGAEQIAVELGYGNRMRSIRFVAEAAMAQSGAASLALQGLGDVPTPELAAIATAVLDELGRRITTAPTAPTP